MKIFSDKTARKHLHNASYDYEAKIAELQLKIQRHEQVKRIAEKYGLRPISGADIKKGTILHLRSSESKEGQIFPFVPYEVTRKVKSRAYSGSHPPDWNIDLKPVGHNGALGGFGIRKAEWFWTPANI